MSVDTPDVSVVMGVFNGGPSLRTTLASVLSQTGVSLEFVVVDDGSTDETPDILAATAARDPRLRVLRQENAGLTSALIAGCAAARSQLIARIDAGDIALPMRLKRQAEVLGSRPDCVFVSCWTEFISPNGEPLRVETGRSTEGDVIKILHLDAPNGVLGGPTTHSSTMFKLGAYNRVGGYRSEFYFGQDWDLWYRLAEIGGFCMIDEVLSQMRLGTGSLSGLWRARQSEFARYSEEAMRRRQTKLPEDDILAEAAALSAQLRVRRPNRRQAAEARYSLARALIGAGRSAGIKHLLSAIAQRPEWPRPWLALAVAPALLLTARLRRARRV